MKINLKISQFSGFLLRPGYAISVNISKWLKLLNFVPFIRNTSVNHVYNWIWSFGLTFTVLQWMNTNFKISQLSGFLLRPWNTIFVKIWKWLKLLNSLPFIKETRANHFYNRIWSYFTAVQPIYGKWRETSKLVNFLVFLLRSGPMRFWSKFENDWNFLILFHSCRKHLQIMFTFEFDHMDWISQFYSEWRQMSKLVNCLDFC